MHPSAPDPAARAPRTAPAVGRRAAIAGVGGAALLLAAGCNPFGTSSAPSTVTETAATDPTIDPIASLIATTRLAVLNLEAAATVDKERAALLKQLLGDRQAHLEALLDEYARTDRAKAESMRSAGGSVPVPADADAALEQVRADATQAYTQFTDGLALVSRYRAALFGSIAACLQTHRVVLG
ncbi:hypothetical protein GIS00_07125 [Nakamurella sp. YIM 132087]|uniref:Uncharacterized protein n=1 Tax=Nakamurella alba TaxID=2665158 RepID=A0A7K1FLF7_9ACTN|nr:hypothetical protein [Nakamurella alba]MTD13714.1 hypothetical protein [Nakamurella alba]